MKDRRCALFLFDIVKRFINNARDDRRCGSVGEVFYFHWKSSVHWIKPESICVKLLEEIFLIS